MESVLKKKPTFVYFAPFDLNHIYNPHFHTDVYPTPQINGITNRNLPFPLLSQRRQLVKSMLCDEKTISNCTVNFCECTYVVKVNFAIISIELYYNFSTDSSE